MKAPTVGGFLCAGSPSDKKSTAQADARADATEFAAMRPDGVLRSYFRPKQGADYWREQIGG